MCQFSILLIFPLQHQPARIIDVNFSKPKNEPVVSNSLPTPSTLSPATITEQHAFLNGLKKLYPSAAILTSTFSQPTSKPRPTTNIVRLPATISSLYHPKYKNISEQEMKEECKRVFKAMKISKEEADYLAKSTHLQSKSLIWFEQRRGRLTASRFHSICHTKIQHPSQSLISAVFQHNAGSKSAPITWGLENERVARQQYEEASKNTHSSFQIKPAGLYVNPNYPHLGASPDGLVTCTCCGDGLLEIKCPYSIRHTTPNSAGNNFYLKHTSQGLKLSPSHAYYSQVQGQLAICDRLYCDFVCWTPKGIHIERIFKDDKVFLEMKPKLEAFFIHIILPCVLRGQMEKENTVPASDLFCYCCKGEKGDMIACDNKSCAYEWFHFSCVGLKFEPEGAWFCPDCQMQRQ